MLENSSIRPVLKRDEAISSLGVFSVFLIFFIVVPINIVIKIIFLVGCLFVLMASGLALGFPARCQKGIALVDEGFLWCIPMKNMKLIRFSDILKIEILRDSCDEDSLIFLVNTECYKIRLEEEEIVRTGIEYAFFALPEFQKDLYQNALKYKFDNKKNFWLGKKFTVYTKA